MKCPYCNEKLIKYKNSTNPEELYYCGAEECQKTYRVLASKPAWQLLTKLTKENKNEQTLA